MKKNALWIVLCVFMTSCGSQKQETNKQPNILVVLADDMGYSDLSCYGAEIPTPNLDKLAQGGLRQTQFYNAARCCPSRASLLTGRYPHEAGMGHQNQDRGLPAYRGRIGKEVQTIASQLQDQGYATYHIGKWHVGNDEPFWPENRGFDQGLSFIEGAMSYFNQWPWVKGQDSMLIRYNGSDYKAEDDFFATDVFSDTAAAFLNKQDKDEPFFMYLAYTAPHWPLHVKEGDRDPFVGKYDMGWDSLRQQRFARMKDLGVIPANSKLAPRHPEVPAWNSLSSKEKDYWTLLMELYAAVVHRMDKGIGRVMKALEANGQDRNTLVIFLSDNGACHEDPLGPWMTYPMDGELGGPRSFPAYELPWANASNTPFRYFKSFLHEGGIRTPFIASFPGKIPAGKIDSQTVGHLIDLAPSFLDMAGGEKKEDMPGISLREAWSGEESGPPRQLFWEHQYNKAVRSGDWKMVSVWKEPGGSKGGRGWLLYDLEKDPSELTDLSNQYPDTLQALIVKYEDWADRVGALEKTEMDSLMKSKKK